MSRQAALFDGGADPRRYQVADKRRAGWVLRYQSGRRMMVDGQNEAGEYVGRDCDNFGKVDRAALVGVCPEDHPAIASWRRPR